MPVGLYLDTSHSHPSIGIAHSTGEFITDSKDEVSGSLKSQLDDQDSSLLWEPIPTRDAHYGNAIASLLERWSLHLEDILFLGVTTGPGPYTSLRNGLAFMSGFALARRLPIFAVSTYSAIAFSALCQNPELNWVFVQADNKSPIQIWQNSANMSKDALDMQENAGRFDARRGDILRVTQIFTDTFKKSLAIPAMFAYGGACKVPILKASVTTVPRKLRHTLLDSCELADTKVPDDVFFPQKINLHQPLELVPYIRLLIENGHGEEVAPESGIGILYPQ